MYTINGEITNQIEINKSIFITYLKHVESVDEAKSYLKALREKYPDATHHVSGYIIGKTGEAGHYDDDGEPSGTAGLPMFEVLRKNELTNIVVDVIRYFGGIKLGAGGLVRAYSKSISTILKMTNLAPIIEYNFLEVRFDYNFLKLIEKVVNEAYIIKRHFDSSVELILKVPNFELDEILAKIKNLTQNNAKMRLLDNYINIDEET